MDLRKVKKLIELVEDSSLTELEICEGEESVRLSRISQSAPVTAAIAPAQAAMPPLAATAAVEEPAVEDSRYHGITSPVVGTYYASADPETPPFVEIGSIVKPGDTLCIIEAMKIFNAIEADRAGSVREIKKSNGDPVEYGEVLFLID